MHTHKAAEKRGGEGVSDHGIMIRISCKDLLKRQTCTYSEINNNKITKDEKLKVCRDLEQDLPSTNYYQVYGSNYILGTML